MNRHHLISLVAASMLVIGCQPAAALTDEPVTAEPTAEPTEAAITETSPATATASPAAQITAPPTDVPTIDYGPVPTLSLETYVIPIEGCPFLPAGTGESVIGTLTQPAWTEQVYSDFDTRFIVGCNYLGEDNSLFVRVWVADTQAEARAEFDSLREYAGDDAVQVMGMANDAFWWPLALKLEVLDANSRLSISFAKPLDDSANTAAQLALAALPLIDPLIITEGSDPPTVMAAEMPTPDMVRDLSQEPEYFEACDLITEAEIASVIGTTIGAPTSGGSIGEMVGYFYDCSASSPTGFFTYAIHTATPAAAINLFRQNEQPTDSSATELPLEIEDRARFYQLNEFEYQANILRGNVVINFLISTEASPEHEQRIRELIALVIERLFEQYRLE